MQCAGLGWVLLGWDRGLGCRFISYLKPGTRHKLVGLHGCEFLAGCCGWEGEQQGSNLD